MRTPFIAGNWKMNMMVSDAVDFVDEIKVELDKIDGVDVAICPPSLAIPQVAEALADTKVDVGAQNIYYAEKGAYTGEISAEMIEPYCQYVILGHSERRAYFAESDELVNKKAVAALAQDIIPIICVGESLAQNEAGDTVAVVSAQVKGGLAGLSGAQVASLVIAYEPIWAIGTGRVAEPADADKIIFDAIRQPVADLYDSDVANALRIQYGGSVKPHNIASFMAMENIDGALVGGASLKPSFVELVQNGI